MPNNPTLNEEAGLGPNWVAVDSQPIVPGRNNTPVASAPAFVQAVEVVPRYNQGTLGPNFQHDSDFSDTAQPTSSAPHFSLFPLGVAQSAVGSSQITSIVKSTTTPSLPATLFYQEVESGGAVQVQRPILNFLGATVTDNASNGSTDVSIWYQTVQNHGAGVAQHSILNFVAPMVATDDPGNSSTDISIAVFGASGPSHSIGAVPDPGAVAGTTHFLREDSTWALVVTLPIRVTINGTAEATNKQFWFNGVVDGSRVWNVTINSVSDGG